MLGLPLLPRTTVNPHTTTHATYANAIHLWATCCRNDRSESEMPVSERVQDTSKCTSNRTSTLTRLSVVHHSPKLVAKSLRRKCVETLVTAPRFCHAEVPLSKHTAGTQAVLSIGFWPNRGCPPTPPRTALRAKGCLDFG